MSTDPAQKRKSTLGIVIIALCLGFPLSLPFLPSSANARVAHPAFNDVGSDSLLLYFGFPFCAAECSATLHTLSQHYQKLPPKNLSVLFVNLIPGTEPGITDAFVKAFHPDFRSYQPDRAQLDALLRQFPVEAKPTATPEISVAHSDYSYLLKRENGSWRLRYVFQKLPSNFEAFTLPIRR